MARTGFLTISNVLIQTTAFYYVQCYGFRIAEKSSKIELRVLNNNCLYFKKISVNSVSKGLMRNVVVNRNRIGANMRSNYVAGTNHMLK